MADLLDLDAEPLEPKRPVVCFEESPSSLIGEVRQPMPAKPRPGAGDADEHHRNGTENLGMALAAHQPWRKVKPTERRTAVDLAVCRRELAKVAFPAAERIRLGPVVI